MGRKRYEGQDITVTFDMARCIHARNCFLKLPQAFDPGQRPWVQPDAAPAEEIRAMIRTCPSGALQYEGPEAAPGINRVAVLENGPLAVAGALTIDGADDGTRATLCRCGLSKTKPYCDNSHVEGGFSASGEPDPKTPPETEGRGEGAAFTRLSDGPLKVEGVVEITTGTGGHIARHEKAFLCRCGLSKNKPYCDGSHKDGGFSDPV